MARIDGFTKTTGIIGYPLNYTLSPLIHNVAFEELGLNWRYLPLPVKDKELSHAVPGLMALGFVGANVTIPYKERVMPWVDVLDEEAGMINAVNTLHFKNDQVYGYNTDGMGFRLSLQDRGFEIRDSRVLIAGAGGAGRAVAFSVARGGCSYIALLNRSSERASSVKNALRGRFPSLKVDVVGYDADLAALLSRVNLVVNATPVGMNLKRDKPIVPVENIDSSHTVYDLIYSPSETRLLSEAGKRGARVLNGVEMLLNQAAVSFKIWTGRNAPLQAMRGPLLEAVRGLGSRA